MYERSLMAHPASEDEDFTELSVPIDLEDPELNRFVKIALDNMPDATSIPTTDNNYGKAAKKSHEIESELLWRLRFHFLTLEGQIAQRGYCEEYLQSIDFSRWRQKIGAKLIDKWISQGFLEEELLSVHGYFQTIIRPVGLIEAYQYALENYELHKELSLEVIEG